MLLDERTAVDADDFSIGKQPLHHREGDGIEVRIVGGHEYCPVDDEEIGIGGGQPVRSVVQSFRHGQRHEPVRLSVRAAQSLQLLLHGREVGVVLVRGIFRADIDDGTGIDEPRQRVDVPVGVVAGQGSVAEREYTADAEALFQRVDNGRAAQAGVAVRLEEAAVRGQQSTFAIRLQCSSFEDEGEAIVQGNSFGEQAQGVEPSRDEVVVMGGKLHAPAVEGEVGYHRTAVGEEGNASVVARPCIVRGQLEAVEPVVQLGRQQAEHPLAIGANDYQPLVAEYGGGYADEAGFHLVEHIRPVGSVVRPGQLYGLLRCPFGQE